MTYASPLRAPADPRDHQRLVLTEVDPGDHHNGFDDSGRQLARKWEGSGYVVGLFPEPEDRLCVRRCDDRWAGIGWDELNEVKAAVGFADRWAVEMFPPRIATVNTAPIRHLWLLPDAPPLAWPSRLDLFARLAPELTKVLVDTRSSIDDAASAVDGLARALG